MQPPHLFKHILQVRMKNLRLERCRKFEGAEFVKIDGAGGNWEAWVIVIGIWRFKSSLTTESVTGENVDVDGNDVEGFWCCWVVFTVGG